MKNLLRKGGNYPTCGFPYLLREVGYITNIFIKKGRKLPSDDNLKYIKRGRNFQFIFTNKGRKSSYRL